MNILVTGATGFIGSNLVNKLNEENNTLFCTLVKGEQNPFGENIAKTFIYEDKELNNFILFIKQNKIEGIIHLASFVQSSIHKPKDIENLIDSNIKFGTIILEAAVQANIRWFINTGTYWQNYNSNNYSPVNLYAATKQAFISIAEYFINTHAIKFVNLKLFDTYGPNDNRPKIFNLWKKIGTTKESLDMSPGNQIIDLSYIDDIVDAYVLLANLLHSNNFQIANGATYAVKAAKRYTLKELAFIFENTTGYKLNINWGKLPYPQRQIMTPIESLETVPGWKPKVSIEEGIRKLIGVNL